METTAENSPEVTFSETSFSPSADLSRRPPWRRGASRALVCLTCAIMVLCRYIALVSDDTNRFFLHWSRLDGIALCLAVAGTGAAGFAVDRALDRFWPRSRRGVQWILLWVCLAGPLGFVTPSDGWGGPTGGFQRVGWAWLAAGAAIAVVRWRFGIRALRGVYALLLTFSPIVPILAVCAARWPQVATPDERWAPNGGTGGGAVPVVVLLFDELSYDRSTTGDSFHPGLGSFRRLAATSVSFTHAESEGFRTWFSVPRFLFQTTRTPLVVDGRMKLRGTFGEMGDSNTASWLFTGLRSRGYSACVTGFYMPYRRMLGNQADWCASRPYLACFGRGIPQRIATVLARAGSYMPWPIGPWAHGQLEKAQRSYWREVDEDIRRDALRLVSNGIDRTAAFVHWNAPHSPFLGTPVPGIAGPAAGYLGAVRHADERLGEVMDAMRRAGILDRSLLIVTSDHAWREETDPQIKRRNRWIYHVPLLIKWPGQRSGAVVGRPFSLLQVQPLVEGAADGRDLSWALHAIESSARDVGDTDDIGADPAPE